MKVLVLDDDVARQKQFQRQWIGHDITVVATVAETIECLKKEKWDIAFLDHDLDGKAYISSGPGTGYEVAQWLTKHPQRKPVLIVIHSFNKVGVLEMNLLLIEAIIAPFAWDKDASVWDKDYQERLAFQKEHSK